MLALLSDILRRTRQHHAIEHATIHILAARFPRQRFSGLSDPIGFTIYGDVDELALRKVVGDALLRLQAGEHALAIHPNCGTNLATTGILATLAAAVGLSVRRNFIERLVIAFILVLPTLVIARPLGLWLQEYTTLANVSDRWLADIRTFEIGGVCSHRVIFD